MSAGESDPFSVSGMDERLHAYADRQLDAAGRAEVEAWLAEHPEAAVEVARWRRQNDGIRALFDPVAAEPVPERLNPHRLQRGIVAQRWQNLRVAAAVVLVPGFGAGAGWIVRTATWTEAPASVRLITGALAAHNLYAHEKQHAVEMDGSSPALLAAWLSHGIGRQIVAPDLSAQGFMLVGGRVLPPIAETGTGPAAQIMYQNATASRVTLYITAAPVSPGKASENGSAKGVEAYYWADKNITCTVVGDLPDPVMAALTRSAVEQLSWRPAA